MRMPGRVLQLAGIGLAAAWGQGATAGAPKAAAINPTKAKSLSEYQAQLEANKRVAAQFYAPGATPEQRYEPLHKDYIQHNPAFKKFVDDNALSFKEGFKGMPGLLPAGGPPGGPGALANASGPQPPSGNNEYLLPAENDLVFIMRQQSRQEPTTLAGNLIASCAWDTFPIKDGKLFEHWSGALVDPPPLGAPAGAPNR